MDWTDFWVFENYHILGSLDDLYVSWIKQFNGVSMNWYEKMKVLPK